MPRVLLVHQPTEGGVGRHVRDLAAGLAGRGYEVMLGAPDWPHGLDPTTEGVRHVELDLGRAVSPGMDFRALRELGRVLRCARPDIVHAHSSKAGALARLARVCSPRVPILYTPHGYAFAGYFSSELERFGYREVERVLAPLASRVVCVCEAEARLAGSVGSRRRVRVVHNGIAPDRGGPIDPMMVDLARRGPVLCAVTQLRAGKGIETLIDAAPSVLRGHPNLQIVIWGDGPELSALRARAASAGIAGALHFPGASDDPLAVLRGAHVFVHPSLAEAFPYVILEAMSVGAAIVASDVGGVGEALVGGESGVLVAPGDAPALAEALTATLDEVTRSRTMGDAARTRFERHFTLRKMLDGTVSVYGEVAARS
ncbi:MAG: glycosyltransferase [Solirubrobacteraceae bacterium]